MKPVIIIAIAFVLLIPIPIFAQEYLVSFQMDKKDYFEGDTVTISGTVRGITGNVDEPVTIKILYHTKKIVDEKVTVAQDGSFTKTFDPIMEDKSWREGEYFLIVSIGDYTESTWLSFTLTDNLANECPRYFPDIGSDGLCFDAPEPVKQEVGMRWHQNELYDYSFDIPTD